jgi:hypothetical protein
MKSSSVIIDFDCPHHSRISIQNVIVSGEIFVQINHPCDLLGWTSLVFTGDFPQVFPTLAWHRDGLKFLWTSRHHILLGKPFSEFFSQHCAGDIHFAAKGFDNLLVNCTFSNQINIMDIVVLSDPVCSVFGLHSYREVEAIGKIHYGRSSG